MATINDLIKIKYPDVDINTGKKLLFQELMSGVEPFNQTSIYKALQLQFPGNTGTFNDLMFEYLLSGGVILPVIQTQPSNQSVTAGATATFSVVVTVEEGTLSYQWQVNTGSSWSDIAGAASSTYTTTATQASWDGYQYRVVVTADASGQSITSNVATLAVSVPVAGEAVMVYYISSTNNVSVSDQTPFTSIPRALDTSGAWPAGSSLILDIVTGAFSDTGIVGFLNYAGSSGGVNYALTVGLTNNLGNGFNFRILHGTTEVASLNTGQFSTTANTYYRIVLTRDSINVRLNITILNAAGGVIFSGNTANNSFPIGMAEALGNQNNVTGFMLGSSADTGTTNRVRVSAVYVDHSTRKFAWELNSNSAGIWNYEQYLGETLSGVGNLTTKIVASGQLLLVTTTRLARP